MQFPFKSFAAFASLLLLLVPENINWLCSVVKIKFSKAHMQNGKRTCATDYFKTFWFSVEDLCITTLFR